MYPYLRLRVDGMQLCSNSIVVQYRPVLDFFPFLHRMSQSHTPRREGHFVTYFRTELVIQARIAQSNYNLNSTPTAQFVPSPTKSHPATPASSKASTVTVRGYPRSPTQDSSPPTPHTTSGCTACAAALPNASV
jgi:hypothetical protein